MSNPEKIVAPEVLRYLAGFRRPRDPLLARLEAEAAAEGWPILHRESADFLEVGTAIGYSGTIIARALPPWGNLETIEIDLETAERARRNFAEGGLAGKVRVHRGAALQVIPTLQNRYDLAFIDTAKEEYEATLRAVLPLMPAGGVVVVDNLLWSGRVDGPPVCFHDSGAP